MDCYLGVQGDEKGTLVRLTRVRKGRPVFVKVRSSVVAKNSLKF